jgi:hypothetical protein
MGIFDSFFEVEGPSPAKAFVLKEKLPIILSTKTIEELRFHIENYGEINHPDIQFAIASQCIFFELHEEAKKHFVLSAKHGFKPGSEYYNTPSVSNIGSSLALLLREFEYTALAFKNATLFNLTVLAYVHLTKYIISTEKNHSVRQARVELINRIEDPTVRAIFYDRILGENSEALCKIADLTNVAEGYKVRNPAIAKEYSYNAEILKRHLKQTLIDGKPADMYSMHDLCSKGDRIHLNAFVQLEGHFLAGTCNVTEDQVKEILV